MLGFRKEICEGHLGRWCPRRLGENYYQAIAKGFLGEETWFLCAHILLSSRRCLIYYEILDPLRIIRLEGGGYRSEYKLAFPEMAGTWDIYPICIFICT